MATAVDSWPAAVGDLPAIRLAWAGSDQAGLAVALHDARAAGDRLPVPTPAARG